MKRVISWVSVLAVAVLFILASLLPGIASADGGTVAYDGTDMVYLIEESQTAVIDWEDGVERMYVSIEVEDEDVDDAYWILPIPANFTETDVHIESSSFRITGIDASRQAKRNLEDAYLGGYAYVVSAFVPAPLVYLYLGVSSFGGDSTGLSEDASMGANGGGVDSVVVRTVESRGLTVDIVSSTSGSAISAYLASTGHPTDEKLDEAIADYAGQDFSFVIARLTGGAEMLTSPGLTVTFPSDRPFFPLKLTSIYGGYSVPFTVIVKGQHEPVLYDGIRGAYVSYRFDGRVSGYNSSDSESFFASFNDGWDGRFTFVHVSALAYRYVDDLYFEAEVRKHSITDEFVAKHFDDGEIWIFVVLLVILAPTAYSFIFFRWREMGWTWFLALVGGNLFASWLGLAVASVAFWGKQEVPTWRVVGFYLSTVGTLLAILLFIPLYLRW